MNDTKQTTTPRTDGHAVRFNPNDEWDWVNAREMRTLERELAALRADNAQLRYALADFLSLATPAKCLASVKWTSLRDHARAALAGEKGKNRTK